MRKKPRRDIRDLSRRLGVVDVKDAPSKIFIVHESSSKATWVALKSSGFSQDPGYRTRASFANSTKERVNLEHRQVSPRFYLPNRRDGRFYTREFKHEPLKRGGKPDLKPLSGPRSCSNCYCCFRLRSNVFLIVTAEFRLHLSVVYDRVLIVESCSWTGVLS